MLRGRRFPPPGDEAMTLAGKHAFVTGGGRGIGRAVAAALARAGAAVTVIGRTEAPLREAVAAGEAVGCGVADVTDVVEVKRQVTAAEAARGPIAILINNAGSVESGPFIKADPSVFRAMWNVHLMGAVYATQAVLPGMIERGFGRIVNVASTAGLRGYAYISAYCAAKHALVGLTRALAAETAARGVTVNAVCPGYTDTELVRDSIERVAAKTGRAQADVLAEYAKDAPIGRLIRPEEVAAAVVYLCSPVTAAASGEQRYTTAARDRGRGDVMQERTMPLDAETKVAERPHDHKDELRLWLRLFTCKEVIESEVRRRLRDSFDVTLPRFDLMAQLYRAPKAMTLGELSQRMMVSNGNVTGLVDRLVEQGLVSRRPSPKDRRAQLVTLTAEGRRFFRAMARANGDWIGDMFAELSADDIEILMRLLAKTKASARKAIGNGAP